MRNQKETKGLRMRTLLMASPLNPGKIGDSHPHRIVINLWDAKELAVHMQTPHDRGLHNGDYYPYTPQGMESAINKFRSRCVRYQIDPEGSEMFPIGPSDTRHAMVNDNQEFPISPAESTKTDEGHDDVVMRIELKMGGEEQAPRVCLWHSLMRVIEEAPQGFVTVVKAQLRKLEK